MEEILHLLRQSIGLDASSIGQGAVERAVQQRMKVSGIPSIAQYHIRLRESVEELRCLIEGVIVPETWFFRDPGAFSAVIAQVRRTDLTMRTRILCVPCATGEEPFSLAMALLDAGIPAERFHIDAVDVSARVIEHASRAIYNRNSFRGDQLQFRDRYFKKTAEGWELDGAIRRLVNFQRANLVDETGMQGIDHYHAVFCRNLLIYFDSETQSQALKTIGKLLTPEGLLCVAPAEAGLILRHEFVSAGLSMAFAFRKKKRETAAEPARAVARKVVPIKPPLRDVRSASRRMRLPKMEPGAAPVKQPTTLPAPSLAEARRMADEGRFAEVCAICDAHIKAHGASADAYYLLALVNDALNRLEDAAGFYRKALYLQPDHHHALTHFSLLAGKLGDGKTAQALRERALRVESKTASAQ